jgi:hypothetical protein
MGGEQREYPFAQEVQDIVDKQYRKMQEGEEVQLERLGRELGFRTIRADTVTSIKASDFTNPLARPVYAGPAEENIIAGVAHRNIGMGIAHYRPSSKEVLVTSTLHQITNMSDDMPEVPKSSGGIYWQVSRKLLLQRVIEAVEAAIINFLHLSSKLPEKCTFLAIGASHLNEEETIELEKRIQTSFRKFGTDNVGFRNMLGKPGGIIWGGPNHLFFPEPGFFDLTTATYSPTPNEAIDSYAWVNRFRTE